MIDGVTQVSRRFAVMFVLSRKEQYGRELMREINYRMSWRMDESDVAMVLMRLEKRRLVKCRDETNSEYAARGAKCARRKYWRSALKGDREVEKFLKDLRKLLARK